MGSLLRVGYMVPWNCKVEERQLSLQPVEDDPYCDLYYYEHEKQAPEDPNATPQMKLDGDIGIARAIYHETRMEFIATLFEVDSTEL